MWRDCPPAATVAATNYHMAIQKDIPWMMPMMVVVVVVAMVAAVVATMVVVMAVVVVGATAMVVVTWPRDVLNAGYWFFPRRFGISIYTPTNPTSTPPSNATPANDACPH